MISEITDEEVKADVMNRLLRKGCWGAKYFPLGSLVNWLAKKVKSNGKRVRKIIKELANDGYYFCIRVSKQHHQPDYEQRNH